MGGKKDRETKRRKPQGGRKVFLKHEEKKKDWGEGKGGRGKARLEVAAELVDDEGREGLLLDVLGHDEEREAALHGRLQDSHDVARCADLFVNQQQAALRVLRHLRSPPAGPPATVRPLAFF